MRSSVIPRYTDTRRSLLEALEVARRNGAAADWMMCLSRFNAPRYNRACQRL